MSKQNIQDRFYKKTKKNIGNGCLEWQGAKDNKGYGIFRIDGKNHQAHRVAYSFVHGEIPEGMKVLHNCDNRACISDEHLRLGTQQDNVSDMINKGRWNFRGNACRLSKLTELQVQTILLRLRNGEKQETIANDFGVTRQAISDIKRKITWKHAKLKDMEYCI